MIVVVLSAEVNPTTVEALDKFNFVLEAIGQKPFGNSVYSFDETLGLILTNKCTLQTRLGFE